MSRTRRIKNYAEVYNCSWNRQGKKLALEYTERDFIYPLWAYQYRAPTEREHFEKDYRMHGESRTANERSPGKEYRGYRNKQNRALCREELHRFMIIPDYEPMIEEEPRSCARDWR